MKNIIEILKGLGIDVPEDKTAELNRLVSENYKTVAEFDKKVGKAETEQDAHDQMGEKTGGGRRAIW